MSDIDDALSTIESKLRTSKLEQLYDELDALNSEISSPEHYIKRSEIYEKLKNYSKSIEDLNQALSLPALSKLKKQKILSRRLKLLEVQEDFARAIEDAQLLYQLTNDESWQLAEQKLNKSLKEQKLKKEAGEFLMIFKANSETKPGSEWHVVSMSWFDKWQSYVQISHFYMEEEIPFKRPSQSLTKSDHPGIIDNSDIIDFDQTSIVLFNPAAPHSKITLKKGKSENFDYILLPSHAFEYLYTIYNCSNDIKRYAIEINDTMYQVEVTLKSLNIACYLHSDLVTNTMNISAKETIEALKKAYLSTMNISGASKVWKINLQVISIEKLLAIIKTNEQVFIEGGKVLNDNLLLDDAEIAEQDLLFVELKRNECFLFTDDNKKVKDRCGFCQSSNRLTVSCSRCRAIKYCTSRCQQHHSTDHKAACRPRPRSLLRCFCRSSLNENSDEEGKVVPIDSVVRHKEGLVGLQNIGNSCFMNAALQCLSHTNEVTEVFLSGRYIETINKTNPLGTNGKLVQAYAELLHSIWKGSSSSIAPWKIRRTISAYAPQFVGYQQHDAQELLGFMLDRIHEDLNQVKKKPYFEDSDIVGASDFEKAKESWRRHTLRNQSVIVDLMHGQYKSSVDCPECKKCSITFDPFNSITLPLPQSQEKTLSFYFIFYESEKVPFNIIVEYAQGQTIEHLRKEVSKILNLNENTFIFASILNDTVKEFLKDSKIIDSLKNFTIFAYELRDIEDFETIEIQVCIEKGKVKGTSYSRIVNLNKNSNFKELQYEIFRKFKKHFPKLSGKPKPQENYEDFLENPAYLVQFSVSKDQPCQFCKEKSCKGCPVPYSNEKLKKIFSNTTVKIEVIWRSSHQSQGANISDLNRCTEHESVAEVLQRSKKMPVKLEECFELFRVPEKLEKDNAWYCPSCQKHVLATKKLEIFKVPPILIIHIKRFRVNGHSKEKLYNPVIFPETGLDIRNWVIGNEETKIYDLYAVCNHFGNLAGGHYTATCFSTLNKKWFDFKDSQVVATTDNNNSASAYVLFYRARK